MQQRHLSLVPAVLSAALALSACGTSATTAPPTTTAPPEKPSSITIRLHPGNLANAKEHDYTLTCAPAGGTLPNAARACAALASNLTLLAPTAECPMRIADTGSEEVSGTWQGQPLALAFHGCTGGEERWPRLAAVLGLDGATLP